MKSWLKRIRGAVGMGVTWAPVWVVILTVVTLVFGFGSDSWPPTLGNLLRNAVLFSAMGFVGGAAFSGVLRLAEGRRRFDEMSLPRFASWGAIGGVVLFLIMSLPTGGISLAWLLTGGGACALLGAVSAAGSLALARWADDRELLEAGVEAADVGLSENETWELLGR